MLAIICGLKLFVKDVSELQSNKTKATNEKQQDKNDKTEMRARTKIKDNKKKMRQD